ncbi:hypothetical protein [Vibrio vulnificus]|uniref:hypothetical protein n=1 Tax=Vibrio vulnificus TaxID=672 RepID=UPI0005F2581C|nr:hypothetical protein [Vibrio vulnificus]
MKKTFAVILSCFSLNACVSHTANDFSSAYDYLKATLTPTLLGLEVPISGDQEVFFFRNTFHSVTQKIQSNANIYWENDIRYLAFTSPLDTEHLMKPLIYAHRYCKGRLHRLRNIQGEFFYDSGTNTWVLYKNSTSFLYSSAHTSVPASDNPKSIQEALFISEQYFGLFACESNEKNWTIEIAPTAFSIDKSGPIPAFTTGIVVRVSPP